MTATSLYVLNHVLPVSAALLPPQMDTPAARAMLVSIGLQESGFRYRRQVAGRGTDGTRAYGPARGWWQFEMGGTEGVLEHRASRESAAAVLTVLGYGSPNAREVHLALEHNDVLASCFARLLLWTDPRMLPQDASKGPDAWLAYYSTWRPGKPRPQTWAAHFAAAWTAVS